MQSAQDWVSEKRKEEQQLREKQLRQEIEKDLHSILQKQPGNNSVDTDNQIKILSEKLAARLEQMVSETENNLKEITNAFVTGNIRLTSLSHERKLIELLILLQETQTGESEQLFKKCSSTDIAAILRLHFDAFKDKKLNTLQKKIAEHTAGLHETNDQKVKKLTIALEDFFGNE